MLGILRSDGQRAEEKQGPHYIQLDGFDEKKVWWTLYDVKRLTSVTLI